MSENINQQLVKYFDKKQEIEKQVSDLVKSPILASTIMRKLEDSLIQGNGSIQRVPRKFENQINNLRKELKKFYPFKPVVVY